MRDHRIGLIGAAGALLGFALLVMVFAGNHPRENRFAGDVRALLPKPPAGWRVTERAIADTPEMKQAVGEILNYDDAVFVDYVSAQGDRISVYLAYWQAGKMATRLVAGHTPDVCWVGNGWQRVDAEQVAEWGAPAQPIPLGQVRVFEINGQTEHVVFWHLAAGEAVSYGTMGSAPWHAALTDLWAKGLNQNPEQFFFRLSAPIPLNQPNLQAVVDPIIAEIAAAADSPPNHP